MGCAGIGSDGQGGGGNNYTFHVLLLWTPCTETGSARDCSCREPKSAHEKKKRRVDAALLSVTACCWATQLQRGPKSAGPFKDKSINEEPALNESLTQSLLRPFANVYQVVRFDLFRNRRGKAIAKRVHFLVFPVNPETGGADADESWPASLGQRIAHVHAAMRWRALCGRP